MKLWDKLLIIFLIAVVIVFIPLLAHTDDYMVSNRNSFCLKDNGFYLLRTDVCLFEKHFCSFQGTYDKNNNWGIEYSSCLDYNIGKTSTIDPWVMDTYPIMWQDWNKKR